MSALEAGGAERADLRFDVSAAVATAVLTVVILTVNTTL
jgi:hypothetical protein